MLSHSNGLNPVSITYKMTPNDHISDFSEYSFFVKTSGATKLRVVIFEALSFFKLIACEIPKFLIFGSPFGPNIILSSLSSLCIILYYIDCNK